MNDLDPQIDEAELCRLLVDTNQDLGESAIDSKVAKLRTELEVLVKVMQTPGPCDAVLHEAGCVRSVELARRIALNPSAEQPSDANVKRDQLDEHPPRLIGPYQVLELIGQGGMGAVFKALHPLLEKTVAIKVLSAARLGDREMRERFQREMRAVGKLDHPHLIRALDAGEAGGEMYLVMEFVAGVDLGALLKKHGPFPIAEACELIAQAAAGLHAAHSRGMIHRDIKPANLMLAEQEFGPPIVKVLDLGLALLSESQTPNGGLTSDGKIMGTIDYMPPEQAQDSHLVDERADIYSLGASLYALLTGGSIFSGRPNATLMQKLLTLATEPIPPIRERRPEVSEPLAAIVHRMVTRDPKQRFASMAEVIAALKPFAAGAELSALRSPHQHDALASGSFDTNTQLIAIESSLADDHSLARRASGTSATVEISQNARGSGSSVVAGPAVAGPVVAGPVVAGLLTEPRPSDRRSPNSAVGDSVSAPISDSGDLRSSEVARSGDRPQQASARSGDRPQRAQPASSNYSRLETKAASSRI